MKAVRFSMLRVSRVGLASSIATLLGAVVLAVPAAADTDPGAPVAHDDAYTLYPDEAVVPLRVEANDTPTGEVRIHDFERPERDTGVVLYVEAGTLFADVSHFAPLGTVVVHYDVIDGQSRTSAPATITLTVEQDPSRGPVAVDDDFTDRRIMGGGSYVLDVLANDTDPFGRELTITGCSDARRASDETTAGVVTVAADARTVTLAVPARLLGRKVRASFSCTITNGTRTASEVATFQTTPVERVRVHRTGEPRQISFTNPNHGFVRIYLGRHPSAHRWSLGVHRVAPGQTQILRTDERLTRYRVAYGKQQIFFMRGSRAIRQR
ncbi:Ig-like domain-containing protein [Nocardioides acrostichi]|uniref:Uncharacterized protein n=1 Tax=Nocardioides acrostichi TaxID=2784339 RepID=A0A930V142_9ACTN|nr:Ig-like domain-containing protein [Nocardioides acrostichi]MBF4163467.1 hypothetical protein [Nocardioides acrostichi]